MKRGLGGFSNFALSFSIICILAGGVTSVSPRALRGRGRVRSAWAGPLVSLFTLAVAATMAQLASSLPDLGRALPLGVDPGRSRLGMGDGLAQPGGPDHGCLGDQRRGLDLRPWLDRPFARLRVTRSPMPRRFAVGLITASQATLNHRGIRLTTRLTNLSGSLILIVSPALTLAMLGFAQRTQPGRLVTFTNFSARGSPMSGRDPIACSSCSPSGSSCRPTP